MEFYPKPASNWIKIKSNQTSVTVLRIYSISDALVKQIRFDRSENRIDLDLSPGTYLVNLYLSDNEQFVIGKQAVVG